MGLGLRATARLSGAASLASGGAGVRPRPERGRAPGQALSAADAQARRLEAIDDRQTVAVEPEAFASAERNVTMIAALGDPKHSAQAFDQRPGTVLDAMNATLRQSHHIAVNSWVYWEHCRLLLHARRASKVALSSR